MATAKKGSWTEANSAARAFKRLMSGDYKSMGVKTLEKYRQHYTEDQAKDIEAINKERKEECSKRKCRSDAGKRRGANRPIEELLLTNPDPTLQPSTKKKHVYQLRGLLEKFKVSSLEQLLKNTKEEIVSRIVDGYKDAASMIGLLKLILQDLKPSLGSKHGDLVEYLRDEKQTAKDRASVKANEKRDNDTTDYQALYDSLQKRTAPGHMEKVILQLYTKGIYDTNGTLTMVPRNYFHSVSVVESMSQTNKQDKFYVQTEGRLIMQKHKTSGVYKYSYVVPKAVRETISESLKEQPRRWLVSKPGGEAFTATALSTLVNKVLGMNITVYRPTIENVMMDRGMDPVPLARAMGHSVDTQLKHYLKREKK